MKLFLPPIGGLTVYCFGDPSKMSDPNVKLALRIHDECNGSDVFGSDICTCRPYLIFGVEEAVKEAQRGGSGVVVYFRKEGRALGEVTKYLVYNASESLSVFSNPKFHVYLRWSSYQNRVICLAVLLTVVVIHLRVGSHNTPTTIKSCLCER